MCTLHVRVTNTAALRLYTDVLGYQVKARVSNYYLDGEDAYHLAMESLQDQVTTGFQSTARFADIDVCCCLIAGGLPGTSHIAHTAKHTMKTRLRLLI